MGAVHALNAAANPRLNLAALVDPRDDAAEALSKQTGAKRAELGEVLTDPTIVGVIVASSTDAHLDHVIQARAAGKAVFCEKPLDLDADRLRAAAAALSEPSAPLFVAFNRRFDPHYRALKHRLDAGVVGKLESLHLINHDPAAPPLDFIPGSGGLFKDFTIHDLDLAPWLLGEPPVEVFAWTACLVDPRIAELGDVDTAKVLLTTASGRLCMISNSRRTGYGYDQRIEAFGASGAVKVDNLYVDQTQTWTDAGASRPPIHASFIERYDQAYRAEMGHFADVIEGASPETGFAASLAALELAEACSLSAREGRPVRL